MISELKQPGAHRYREGMAFRMILVFSFKKGDSGKRNLESMMRFYLETHAWHQKQGYICHLFFRNDVAKKRLCFVYLAGGDGVTGGNEPA